jgi:phage gp29-like protein
MVNAFSPVGSALPPRRDQIAAALTAPMTESNRSGWGDAINIPLARDRMLEHFDREQLPGDVKSTLAAALNGDLHYQSMLFIAMIDSWPRLQKALEEIARLVSVAPWKVVPFAERGGKPTPEAEKIAKEIESMLWGMKPQATRGEAALEETIRNLVRGYYCGHEVAEIRWKQTDSGWQPRCTKPVPARYYGYPYDSALGADDPEDRLMFDEFGSMGARNFQDFPEHRFLVAIRKGHAGHAALGAPLRSLTAYWLAAIYGLKWFMNFTQLYGIPWRHAKVGDERDMNAVSAALAGIGTKGYIVTGTTTDVSILAPASSAGDNLPQATLIKLADEQCDMFILGQTLTSSTGGSGSRALGEVHQSTLEGVVDGVADFVGGVLTHQLIPAMIAVNWGDSVTDLPEMWARLEKTKDEKGAAERMEILSRLGLPMAESYVYEDLGVPIPAADDKLFSALSPPSDPVIEPEKPSPKEPDDSQPVEDGIALRATRRHVKKTEKNMEAKDLPIPEQKKSVAQLIKSASSLLTEEAFKSAVICEIESSLSGVPVVIRSEVSGDSSVVEYTVEAAQIIKTLKEQKIAYGNLTKHFSKP